jgi:hypothetical protein
MYAEIRDQKQDLKNEQFNFNDEDVKGKFSVVYTDFRATHPKFY